MIDRKNGAVHRSWPLSGIDLDLLRVFFLETSRARLVYPTANLSFVLASHHIDDHRLSVNPRNQSCEWFFARTKGQGQRWSVQRCEDRCAQFLEASPSMRADD